jgi:sulfatase maturation enzyme AslB (radical SAM superfamily)
MYVYVHPGPDHRGYYGIMHLMDKMTSCSCLKVHLKRLKPQDDHGATFLCFHCGVPETASKTLKECSRCKLAQYCSVDCQRANWNWKYKNMMGASHKIVCKDLCEFFALFKPPSSATETEST